MNKLKEMFDNRRRKKILRNIFNFSGKIEIKEDRIIGMVSKLSLNYTFKRGKDYGMCLCGYDSRNLNLEDRDYFSNKPIYYVFENINFDKGVTIETFFDVNVVFRNCTFNDYVELDGVNNVIFESNKYLGNNSGKKLFLNGYGKKIKFVNDNLIDSRSADLGINLNFEGVEIVNSSLSADDCDVSIKSKELVLDNAIIECSSFNLSSDNVIYKYSSIIDSKKKINVNNKNNSFDFGSAYAPIMTNNGSIVKEKEKVSEEVVSARQVLISQLKNISELFSNINKNTLEKAEEKINNRAVRKIRR